MVGAASAIVERAARPRKRVDLIDILKRLTSAKKSEALIFEGMSVVTKSVLL